MDFNRIKVIYSLIYSDPQKPIRIQEIHRGSNDIGFPNQTLKFFQIIRKSIKTADGCISRLENIWKIEILFIVFVVLFIVFVNNEKI